METGEGRKERNGNEMQENYVKVIRLKLALGVKERERRIEKEFVAMVGKGR